MKKNIVYFVQDAYGYLCCVEEDVFFYIIGIWKQNSCDFDILTEDKGKYVTKKLFRK